MSPNAQSIMRLIHPDRNPYEGFPRGQWTGHYNIDGSERPIFTRAIERVHPKLIIEVGTFLGGSAMHMARHLKARNLDSVILCVDHWCGGVDHWLRAREKLRPHFGRPSLYYYFLNNVIEAGLTDYIVPFSLDSIAAARFLKACQVQCQMLYIDGSHEQGDVLRDYEAYWELLAPGGAMLVDDLTNWFPGVLHDWDVFIKSRNLTFETEGEKGLVIKP